MMKKIVLIMGSLLLLSSFSGCTLKKEDTEMSSSTPQGTVYVGVVIEYQQNTALIEAEHDKQKYLVPVENMSIQPGDKLSIKTNGVVLETDPGSFQKIYSVQKLK